MNKIKNAVSYVLGLIVLVLGALFLQQKRKTEQVESELNHEKVNNDIKQNEEDRLAARDNADALVDEYEKLRGDDR